MGRKVFVTVGTTKFDKLILEMTKLETLQVLWSQHYDTLILQIGHGEWHMEQIPVEHPPPFNFKFDVYSFKDSIKEDIKNSNLVIGHAGAGTCLEVLEARKPFIAVINDDLMDNHQSELAKKLADLNYACATTCDNLIPTLKSMMPAKEFKPFRFDFSEKCAKHIENLLF